MKKEVIEKYKLKVEYQDQFGDTLLTQDGTIEFKADDYEDNLKYLNHNEEFLAETLQYGKEYAKKLGYSDIAEQIETVNLSNIELQSIKVEYN